VAYGSAALHAAVAELRGRMGGDGGISVLLGGPGIGKTVLLGKLRSELRRQPTVLVSATAEISRETLLRALCAIAEIQARENETATRPVGAPGNAPPRDERPRVNLLIDDGEKLTVEMLAFLQELAALRLDGWKPFAIVIAARPEIEATIDAVGVAGPPSAKIALDPLAREEIGDFIRHQLGRAMVADETFDDEAVGLVAHQSGGVPKLIGAICAKALTAAALEGRRVVSQKDVEAALGPRARLALPAAPPAALPVPAERRLSERERPAVEQTERAPDRRRAEIAVPKQPTSAEAPRPRRRPGRMIRDCAAAAMLGGAVVSGFYAWQTADPLSFSIGSGTESPPVADASAGWSRRAATADHEPRALVHIAIAADREDRLVAPALSRAEDEAVVIQPAVLAPAETRPRAAAGDSVAPAATPPIVKTTLSLLADMPPVAAERPPEPSPAPPAAADPVRASGDPAAPTAATGALVRRGDLLLGTGDFAAARLFYVRAAEQGDREATIAAARTYDPLALQELGVPNQHGDVDAALTWYRKAGEMGDQGAQARIQALQRLRRAAD
jgi:type II secretory pathway predicted ATPase ExeA